MHLLVTFLARYSSPGEAIFVGTLIGLTMAGIIALSNLFASKRQRKEYEKTESLFSKLQRKCNPANFMKPYDAQKVEKANVIFEQLKRIDPQDIDGLMRLRRQATKELNITFLDKDKVEELKSKCNPMLFMEPYNAEKVHLANTLYCKLTHPDIDIEDVEEIEREINDKLVIKGTVHQNAGEDNIERTVHQNADENNSNLVPAIGIAMLIIAILIFITFLQL